MRKYFIVITIVLALCSLVACGDQKATGSVVSSSDEVQEDKDAPYVEGNKKIMQLENEEMQMFIARYGWQMERTPTGLYIEILEPGHGEQFREGDRVMLEYKTFLLSGEQIYNSDSNGVKVFIVNRSEEIGALHEAVQMMRPGAKARLVIPSYLAYGVAGDGDMIHVLQPIVMEIRALENDEQLLKNNIPVSYSVAR